MHQKQRAQFKQLSFLIPVFNQNPNKYPYKKHKDMK